MAHKNAQDAAQGEKRQHSTVQLDAREQRFVEEYLVDLDPKRAALAAGYSKTTAASKAYQWVSNSKVKPHVYEAIQKARSQLSERAEITQEMVLRRWWEIATADPNELIQYRRLCCRYCFGKDHLYQWRDEDEFERACRMAEADDRRPPNDDGGYGFDHKERPHPKCPECHGEGHGDVYVQDTRDLDGGAKLLYDGVKITKNGLEVQTLSRDKALENIARHLGMFNDKLTLKGDGENPLTLLLQQVSGNTLKPKPQEPRND